MRVITDFTTSRRRVDDSLGLNMIFLEMSSRIFKYWVWFCFFYFRWVKRFRLYSILSKLIKIPTSIARPENKQSSVNCSNCDISFVMNLAFLLKAKTKKTQHWCHETFRLMCSLHVLLKLRHKYQYYEEILNRIIKDHDVWLWIYEKFIKFTHCCCVHYAMDFWHKERIFDLIEWSFDPTLREFVM